jgi:serine/threonine protein kinase
VAADYLFQICSGLHYAHEKGIIHRDINPINVMVQRGNLVKILDFGMACPLGTEDDIMGGAFAYLAPELFEGEPANRQSDIYALGITAYELVTGRRPFREDDLRELLKMRETQEVPDPAALVPEIPVALRNFIMKACRRTARERYQTVFEAMEEIRPLVRPVTGKKKPAAGSGDKLTSLILRCGEEQQHDLSRLLEEIREKADAAGINLKIMDLNDF